MIRQLLGIRFRSAIAALGGKSKNGTYKPPSTARILLLSFAFLYLIGAFIFIASSMAVSLCMVTVPYGYDALYFAFYAVIPFAAIFALSIFETKSVLFECKDTEQLLALPIRPRDVVISRILSVLLLNYAEAAILMVPFLVVYALFGGAPIGIVGGLLSFCLIPLLATALSTGIGYLIARLSARVKHKTLLTVLLYVAFFAAYVLLLQWMMSVESDDEMTQIGQMLASVAEQAPLLRFVGEAVLLRPLPFAVLAAVTVGVSLLVYSRITRTFVGLSTERRGQTRTVYTERRLHRTHPFFALVRKELSRFTSSASYMLNASFGIVLEVFLTASLFFFDPTEAVSTLQALGLSADSLAPLAVVILTVCTMTNYIAACSVSLEGQSLWIVRMLPIRAEDILLAKAVPHMMITSVVSIACGIALSLRLHASFGYAVCLVLVPVLANVAAALWGVVLNTAMPKLDYTSEAQVVKQSMSALLGMLLPLALGIVLLILTVLLTVLSLGWLAMLLCALLLVLIAVCMYAVLVRVSARTFQTLS